MKAEEPVRGVAVTPVPPRVSTGLLRITMDIARSGTTLSGVIYSGLESHPFAGWLGLISELENLTDEGPPAAV